MESWYDDGSNGDCGVDGVRHSFSGYDYGNGHSGDDGIVMLLMIMIKVMGC